MTEKEESELALFENYKDGTSVKWAQLFTSFCGKLLACIGNCRESIQMSVPTYNDFIITRAIETLSSLFLILFLYSGNESLTIDHIEKGSYLYVEFLGQIAQEGNMFLGLSSRDASLFLLKKTIYEIPQEVRGSWHSHSEVFTKNLKCLGTISTLNRKLLVKAITLKTEEGIPILDGLVKQGVYARIVEALARNIESKTQEIVSKKIAILDFYLDELPCNITSTNERHVANTLGYIARCLAANPSKMENVDNIKKTISTTHYMDINKRLIRSFFSS